MTELAEVDTQTSAFLNDPNSLLGRGPQRLRVARGRMGVEVFAHDTVRDLFRDPRLRPRNAAYFAERGATPLILDYVSSGMLTVMEAANHDRVKRMLAKAFTPLRTQAFVPIVQSLARELVAQAGEAGVIDFVGGFSHRYTLGSIAQFLGMPLADIDRIEKFTVNFRMLGQVPMTPGVAKLEETIRQVSDYAAELIADRRRNRRDDLISDMVAAQEDEDRLTEAELLWATTNLLNAGHDTTRYELAACVRVLIEADAWERLRAHPELAPQVVAEAMRLFPATPRMVRTPLEPVEVEGLAFLPGEALVLNLAGAGRDPAVFAEPDRANLQRETPYAIGFGLARHACLGQSLARLEMVEALKVLVEAWEPPELAGEIELKPTGVICGAEVMPLRFRRRG